MALSAAVQELIAKARIVSFAAWQETHSAEAIAIFQAADDAGRYLTDAELALVGRLAPEQAGLIPVAQLLRDQVVDIVDEARAGVLEAFPEILSPGGGLYPAERADACWRDFWHFLRCISYGLAGQHELYTSDLGLGYMRQLYEALAVPLDAMLVGLEGLAIASLKRTDAEQHEVLLPYFDHLIARLDEFGRTR
jgi:Phycobilisome protein